MIHNGLCRNPYYDNQSLYKKLCYKNDFINGFNEEPFELFISPKKYYCSQITGLQSYETQVIDNSIEFPEAFSIIIEILTYQRIYSKNIIFLLSEINKILQQNQKYSSLTKSFIPKFTLLCKDHRNLSHEIDEIAFSQNLNNIVFNVISPIIKKIDMMSHLQDFNEELKKNENLLLDISLENSTKESLNINQSSIIQILHSSKSWLLFYVQSITKIRSCFPLGSTNYQHSLEILKLLQLFLDKL